MPITINLIRPSKKRRSPHYAGRWTDSNGRHERSTGVSSRAEAQKIIREWEAEFQRDHLEAAKAVGKGPQKFFADACVHYLKTGGNDRFIEKPQDMLGHMRLHEIDQETIDAMAADAYPNATAATRNRQFHTVVSAVLKANGVVTVIGRPEGAQGQTLNVFLFPEQAFAAFKAADEIDTELGCLIRVLCYTGMRRGECLRILLRQVNIAGACITLPGSDTKAKEGRVVYLPRAALGALARHPRGLDRDPGARLWRFHPSGTLNQMLHDVWRRAKISLPPRAAGFHVFCHTWATWMSQYGDLDPYELAKTRRWADAKSAERYRHNMISPEAKRADLLPTEPGAYLVESA